MSRRQSRPDCAPAVKQTIEGNAGDRQNDPTRRVWPRRIRQPTHLAGGNGAATCRLLFADHLNRTACHTVADNDQFQAPFVAPLVRIVLGIAKPSAVVMLL